MHKPLLFSLSPHEKLMSIEGNKTVVQQYFEARTNGDLDACDEIFASKFIRHTSADFRPGLPNDQKRIIVQWRTEFRGPFSLVGKVV